MSKVKGRPSEFWTLHCGLSSGAHVFPMTSEDVRWPRAFWRDEPWLFITRLLVCPLAERDFSHRDALGHHLWLSQMRCLDLRSLEHHGKHHLQCRQRDDLPTGIHICHLWNRNCLPAFPNSFCHALNSMCGSTGVGVPFTFDALHEPNTTYQILPKVQQHTATM